MTIEIKAGDLDALARKVAAPFSVQFRAGPPVEDSHDLQRIKAIPRRSLDIKDPIAAKLWTQHLRRERTEGPCDCVARWGFCITELRPAQGWALENAMDARAGFFALGVGDGKTGIDILAAMAIPGISRALLLIPPNLKAQLLTRDFPQWSAHFKTPILADGAVVTQFQIGRPVLHIATYSELSSPKNSDLIPRISPDLIIADEGQNLGDPNSARTGRFLRSFASRPQTRFLVQSGSFTGGSIKSFAHFLALALRENAPIPLSPPVVDRWAAALDASDKRNPYPVRPGALLQLASEHETETITDETERARVAYSRRLYDTLGCLATSDPELPVGLEIREREVSVPESIRQAIRNTKDRDERPDGEQLQTPLEVSAVTRRLATGFYYRWRFPAVAGGFCVEHAPELNKSCERCLAARKLVIDRWLAARKKFRSEVRNMCKSKIEHLDSPMLLEHAARRWHEGYTHNDHGNVTNWPPHTTRGPRLTWESEHWALWNELRHTVNHARQAVWESDFLARDVLEWAKEGPGIIWYQHQAFADAVDKLANAEKIILPVYGGGEQASIDILKERGDRPILASIKAHGTGKNLQCFNRNLVANVPSDPRLWEQMLGRTHRQGQRRDVSVDVYRHTEDFREAIRTVQARARFVETVNRNRQRINIATIGWEDREGARVWTEKEETALDAAPDGD